MRRATQLLKHLKIFLAALPFVAAFFAARVHANVVGSDMQNFNPTTSGLDFVTVHSSETLKPGIVNLGLFLNYAVNTLPYFQNTPQGPLNLNDTVLGMDANAGLGLTDNWDLGFSVPMVVSQSVSDQSGARGEFAQTGVTEVKLNTKYRLSGDDSSGFAVIGSMNSNLVENNPWVGNNAGPTFNLEFAFDTTVDDIAYGVNLGYRLRNPGRAIATSRVTPLKDQWIASAAISYHKADWDTKFIGEVFTSLPARSSTVDGDRSLESAELLGGVKHDLSTELSLHGGIGVGLMNGVASPDWRVYSGVNYAFGPLWAANHSQNSDLGQPHDLEQVYPKESMTAAPKVQRFRTQSILFGFNSDQMLGQYDAVLGELSTHLRSGYRELIVEGHTDSIGGEAYNNVLSKRRAETIKLYLVNRFGLNASKITTLGYGKSRPIASNANYQGRRINRRVEFEIIR